MTTPITEPVGVLGVGVEGRSTIHYLRKKGIRDITALDRNPVDGLPPEVKTVFGEEHEHLAGRYATIFRSPGIRPDRPALVAAREAGSLVTSATSYFLHHSSAPVVGVTGTLGKGTASSLIAGMLQSSGFTVHLGGNIGTSPLDFLDDVAPSHRVVLEISSFQAMDLSSSPHVAVVLKTTSEHLDWHRNIEEYHRAKSGLIAHQNPNDIMIYHQDSPGAVTVAASKATARYAYSAFEPVENGIGIEGDQFYWSTNGERRRLPLGASDVLLPGRFNLENVAAALLAATVSGASEENACDTAKKFEGLPHRLEHVTTKNGIRYFNDSYATRPDAALGAIGCFHQTPLALILGGSEKLADFRPLASALHAHPTLAHVALIGETAARLEEAIHQTGDPRFRLTRHAQLEAAVQTCTAAVPPGGAVLLSPACASFGLFPNYKVRGERFRETVLALSDRADS